MGSRGAGAALGSAGEAGAGFGRGTGLSWETGGAGGGVTRIGAAGVTAGPLPVDAGRIFGAVGRGSAGAATLSSRRAIQAPRTARISTAPTVATIQVDRR